MTTRKKLQGIATQVKIKVAETIETNIDKDGKTATILSTTGKVLAKTTDKASGAVKKVIDVGSKRIGLEEYRQELDSALQEALRVIGIQESRIRDLEEKLNQRNDV